jgi:hypothetical protein
LKLGLTPWTHHILRHDPEKSWINADVSGQFAAILTIPASLY